MKWGKLGFVPPTMPWDEDDWHESRLNEQDFWQWLAREHGTLVAETCWNRYWRDEEIPEDEWNAGRRPSALNIVFAECPEAVAIWMAATNEDDRSENRRLWIEVMLSERRVLGELQATARLFLIIGRSSTEQRERLLRELYDTERYQLRLRYLQGIHATELDVIERDRV